MSVLGLVFWHRSTLINYRAVNMAALPRMFMAGFVFLWHSYGLIYGLPTGSDREIPLDLSVKTGTGSSRKEPHTCRIKAFQSSLIKSWISYRISLSYYAICCDSSFIALVFQNLNRTKNIRGLIRSGTMSIYSHCPEICMWKTFWVFFFKKSPTHDLFRNRTKILKKKGSFTFESGEKVYSQTRFIS